MVGRGAQPAARPVRRIVLLGASNLTRSISTVIETARLCWGGPLEVLAAQGHGRSYGIPSTMLGRQLSGITQCGLWTALRPEGDVPTAALVTDIGNDLLYEVPPKQIVGWVETCLDRLEQRRADIVLTSLPIDGLQGLSPSRYYLFRALFFPLSRISLRQMQDLALQLEAGIQQLARGRPLRLVSPQRAWYGLDPIHIKMRHWSAAWHYILGHWSDHDPHFAAARHSLMRWVYLKSLVPERRRWVWLEQQRAQPAGRLEDGTTVGLY